MVCIVGAKFPAIVVVKQNRSVYLCQGWSVNDG